jgi:hypothetical protein
LLSLIYAKTRMDTSILPQCSPIFLQKRDGRCLLAHPYFCKNRDGSCLLALHISAKERWLTASLLSHFPGNTGIAASLFSYISRFTRIAASLVSHISGITSVRDGARIKYKLLGFMVYF